MEQNISSIAKAFYDERKQHSSLSKSAKDSIDSFLCFVSFTTKDESYYPFWATVGFGNCSYFVSEYVCYDYENRACHEDTLEWQACDFIMENRDCVWNFFKKFPTFKLIKNYNNTNLLTLNPIFRAVVKKAFHKSDFPYKSQKRLFRIAACDGFFQYAEQLAYDIATKIPDDSLLCSILNLNFAEQFRRDCKETFLRRLKNVLDPYR